MDEHTIKENVNISREQVKWACDRANERTSDYSKFLTGVASVVFGLSPLIRIYETTFVIKIIFIIALILIVVSLFFGAIHIWLEKNHFDTWSNNYYQIFDNWRTASTSKISGEEALGFEKGMFNTCNTKTSDWPLIWQSLLLFLGFIGLLVVISLSIF
jgi:hypothetical protein